MRKISIIALLFLVSWPLSGQEVITARFRASAGPAPTLSIIQKLSADNNLTQGVSSTATGNLLVFCIGYVSATNQTLTITDNASGGSNTYTLRSASQSLNVAATLASQCYDTATTLRSAVTSLTITGLTTSFFNENFYELNRTSGTWTFDTANGISTGIGTGTNVPGPALSMTGAPGIAITSFLVGDFITVNPAAGSLWTAGSVLSGNNIGANAIITSSAGTQTSAVTDNSSTDVYAASGVAYK